jgi:hypothetical protein
MANEFIIKNGFRSQGDSEVTGSLNVSAGITGSLLGTASFATTASYALNALSASFATQALSASYALTSSYSKNLVISGSINNVDYIDFNTSYTATQPVAGRLSWNNSDGTLDLGMKGGNVTQQIGEEIFYEVRNETGTPLDNGTSVYANGVTTGSGRITAAPFVADGSVREVRYLGLATEDISNGVNGFVTHFGYVRDLDTRGNVASSIAVGNETWAVGDILYAHPTVPGKLTNVKPKHDIIVCIIIVRHQNVGSVFVRPSDYGHIDDLHDVNINTSSLSTGDLLIYDSGSDYWTNSKQLTGSYGLTGSLNATSFTGSLLGTASYATQALSASFATSTAAVAGTTNYVSKFTSGTAIGDSQIFDNGTNVGIGTTTPGSKLSVNGNTQITGSIISTGQITSRTNHGITINPTVQNFGSYMSYVSSTGTLFVGIDDYLGSIFNNGADARNIYSSGNAPIVISTNSTASMVITSAGNVGIGNTNPNAKLDVNGNTIITGSLTVTGGITGSITSASFASTASYVNPLNQTVEITGSLRGQVSTLSITSNTASVDLSTNNFFNLTLVDGANTHINPTNLNPGQTVNIRVTQGSLGTGTVSFPSFVDQASGSLYTGSAVANAIDIVTMITFDSSLVFMSSIRNMI